MFIYKTEVKFRMSLRKHHDVTFAENDHAAYAPCLGPHRKLIIITTSILLNFSQTILKIMHIQKIEK